VRLLEAGFDAAPYLIEHLNDHRLTRVYEPPAMMSSGYQCRVRDLVGYLIRDLAGRNLPPDWIEDLHQVPARAWWERAKQVGEEAYLLANVFPDNGNEVNSLLLWLLQKKHPRGLPKLYRNILEERPQIWSDPVVHAIAHCALPRRRKMELFISGARHDFRKHREAAFEAIALLGQESLVEVAIKLLDELPRIPKENYWRCPEQAVVSLVLRTDDVRVWKALDKAARRVGVGLRMQLLRRVANDGKESERLKERLAFLRAFLEDATLRDMNTDPDRYLAVPAGDDFPRMEVRNYAALELGRLLKVNRTPLSSWDDAQWAGFREEVQKALKR
jgi:hypothetical protein